MMHDLKTSKQGEFHMILRTTSFIRSACLYKSRSRLKICEFVESCRASTHEKSNNNIYLNIHTTAGV
jgi:hypothetical protein